ncbi:MAG: hypothetical protein KME46_34080 [Brasilonema angustatum HA4187-MV1]|jgi:hypothetical protein|nr:hypothetical protein [Brasilonema angustatum HA4187-MV1]
MFSTQISSIEAQVKELLQRADEYRAVEKQTEAVRDAIAQLQKSAATLNAEDEVMSHLFPEFQPATKDDHQEEIHNLKRQLALANNKADEAENLAARYSKDFEALHEERCHYIENAQQWEKAAEQYQLPNDLESFLVAGESMFDIGIGSELQDIAANLGNTPEWCLQSRLVHTFSFAHQIVRENLDQYLPSEMADFWRELQMQTQNTAITVDITSETADNGQLDIFNAIESAKRYETVQEIEAALADEDELDTHLMAIASVLDSCPPNEIPGRVWFFVQNIPSEFDDRILGYLPKSIRFEWDKQRTFVEEEARASIFPEPAKTTQEPTAEVLNTEKPEIKPGDLVQIYSGDTCEVLQVKDIGGRIYVEVKLPEGRKEAYRSTDLKLIDKVEQEARESILPPTQPHYFEINDLVETPTGKVGHIAQIRFDTRLGRIADVVEPGGTQQHPTTELKYVGKYQPVETVGEIAAPVAAATAKKTRKPKAKPATASEILQCKTWEEIRAIAGNDPKLIKEAATSAHTKAEKDLIENLPELIKDYMYETRDFSDLDWLPNYIKQRVRCLLSKPGTAA